MPIRIEDKPVHYDHEGQVEEYIRLRYPGTDFLFNSDREIQGHGSPYWPKMPDPLISEVQYPVVGATRYTRTLQIVDFDLATELMLNCWGVTWDGGEKFPSPTSQEPVTLYIEEPDTIDEKMEYKLYLLDIVRLDGFFGRPDPESEEEEKPILNPPQLFLVALVDYRYMLGRMAIDTNSVNLGTSWTALYQFIATETGVTINGPSVFDQEYLAPDPSTFARAALNPAEAIDQLCYSTGLRPVYDRTTGDFTLQEAKDAADIIEEALGLKEDPESEDPENPDILPSNIDPIMRGGDRPDAVFALDKRMRCRWASDHWLSPVGDQVMEVKTDSIDPIPENGISESHDIVDSTFIIEWFGGQSDQDSETAAKDLLDALIKQDIEWAKIRYEATFLGYSFKSQDQLSKSGTTDWIATRFNFRSNIPEMVVRVETFDNNFYPKSNYCQNKDIYIHANEIAEFTATEEDDGQGGTKLVTKITTKTDTGYNGEPKELTVSGGVSANESFQAFFNWRRGWTKVSSSLDCNDLCNCPGLYMKPEACAELFCCGDDIGNGPGSGVGHGLQCELPIGEDAKDFITNYEMTWDDTAQIWTQKQTGPVENPAACTWRFPVETSSSLGGEPEAGFVTFRFTSSGSPPGPNPGRWTIDEPKWGGQAAWTIDNCDDPIPSPLQYVYPSPYFEFGDITFDWNNPGTKCETENTVCCEQCLFQRSSLTSFTVDLAYFDIRMATRLLEVEILVPGCRWNIKTETVETYPDDTPTVTRQGSGFVQRVSETWDAEGPWGWAGQTTKIGDGKPLGGPPAPCGGEQWATVELANHSVVGGGVSTSFEDCPPEAAFMQQHRAWFAGCSCSRGVRAVLRRWTPGDVSDNKINNLARTIHSKNKAVSYRAIVRELKKAYQ